VVDVGQLYAEREELQSAADAAAVAVAVDCLRGRETDCRNASEAQHYANLNSRDGVSQVYEVCGSDRLDWLPACAAPTADNLTACLAGNPENTRGWVRVSTRTERPTSDASTRFILPPVFAETLSGTNRGTTVGACSRVAWGAPDVAFALTVCENLYNDATDDGQDLAPAPPASPASSDEQRLRVRSDGSYTGRCSNTDSTSYTDGRWPLHSDFGWEDRDFGDTCLVDMSQPGDPSRLPDTTQLLPDAPPQTPDKCYEGLQDARDSKRPLAILVIRQILPDWFEVRGLAAFVVTSYMIPEREEAESTLTGNPCTLMTDTFCVGGYFVGALIPGEQLKPSTISPYGQFGVAPTLGASVMQTVG
jgi:hypothetical protein